jgi:putative peptidoglycan lipid II flippase
VSLFRSSAVMTAGTAVSRVLGFVRAALLATAIGANTAAADAFTTANTIPNSLYMLVAGGVLNAVLVPQLVRAARDSDVGQAFSDRLLTLAGSALLALTVLLTAGAPVLISLYASKWSGELLALAVAFAFWCVPQVFFYGAYTLLGQVLNARGSFGPYMWAPVVNNVVAIAGLAVFVLLFGAGFDAHPVDSWTPASIAVLAGTATLGVVLQAVVLIVPLRRVGFRYRPRWDWRGVGLGGAGRVAAWTFAAVAAGQLAYLSVTNVSAAARAQAVQQGLGVEVAGPTAYTLAFLLFMLPHSLVAVSVVTALFTQMSDSAARDDLVAVRAQVSTGLRVLGVVSLLATAGLVVLGGPAGWLLTPGGPAVQGQAIGLVASVMSLGLVGFSASYLLQRAFYAFEDARTPFVVQAVVAALWTAGNLAALALPTRYVVVGVAASLAASQLLGAGLGALLLRRRLGGIDGRTLVRTHVRLLVAAVVAALAGAGVSLLLSPLTWSGKAGAVVTCVCAGAVITAVYLLGLRVLRVGELDELLRRLPGARRFARA